MAEALPTLHELLSLQGRRALITGAAAGIGQATALRLAEAGADLLLLDRDAEGLEQTRIQVQARFPTVQVHTAVLDLAEKPAIDAFWQDLPGPPPDILVNNAGMFPFEKFERLTPEFFHRVMQVNLEAALWMSQHFVQRRGRRGGVVVNVASIEAFLPFMEDLTHYSVSKAGVVALTRSLAREYGPKGFRFNVLVPGGVMTRGVRDVLRMALRGRFHFFVAGRRFMGRLPMRRFAHPDEVARVVLFLCSDMAAYMQGAVVVVDGGFLSA